jgi:transcriptional regulator with XRE-family HTH domain
MDIRVIIGKNIQRYRRERSLSQEELSFRSESSRAYISGLEAGRRNPTALSLVKFAKALGVSVVDLITENNKDRD